jgi:hypothetical protein
VTVDTVDAWWHSPEMVAGLWSALLAAFAGIGYLLKQWRHDRIMLRELKVRLDDLPKATTMADVISKVSDIHEWWMTHIVKRK